MGVGKPIYVIVGNDGEPIAATPFVESAQNYVAKNKTARFVRVERLSEHSATSLEKRENVITNRIVDMAITAKLQGTSISKFAKARGLKYDDLRDKVNVAWGPSKPWPTGKCGKKIEGPSGWEDNKAFFKK